MILAINAVTSDAVDPVSLQPEFKFSAVALTRVSGPLEAAVANTVEPAVSSTAPAREFAVGRARDPKPSSPSAVVATLECRPHRSMLYLRPAPQSRCSPSSSARESGGAPALGPDDQLYLQGFLSASAF